MFWISFGALVGTFALLVLVEAVLKDHVVPGDGGNTGFFYATARRNQKLICIKS